MTANHRPLEDGDIQLIDRVYAAPCLYNTKDPNYRLIYKKEQEWHSIGENLNMSDLEARKRWTVLRDRYSRELKQLVLHPDSKEFGKSDFFCRMDFLRKFVKKRESKKKRVNYWDAKIKVDEIPISESEENQISGHENSYKFDDSQYSYNTFDEHVSQDPIEYDERHETVNTVNKNSEKQVYHGYGEAASVTYEVVGEDHETLIFATTSNINRNVTTKTEINKLNDSYCITEAEEEKISTAPPIPQSPIITNVCTRGIPTNPNVDMEEYFSKTIALYLRSLSPRYKIKAKVEIMQIIEKYIDLQESI